MFMVLREKGATVLGLILDAVPPLGTPTAWWWCNLLGWGVLEGRGRAELRGEGESQALEGVVMTAASATQS